MKKEYRIYIKKPVASIEHKILSESIQNEFSGLVEIKDFYACIKLWLTDEDLSFFKIKYGDKVRLYR